MKIRPRSGPVFAGNTYYQKANGEGEENKDGNKLVNRGRA